MIKQIYMIGNILINQIQIDIIYQHIFFIVSQRMEQIQNTNLIERKKAFLRKERKVRDTIYGFISFPNKVWLFIDTPQFQRLRNIKQLGTLNYVFPGATHTRFQHCLGVGHLAKTYMNILIENHQEQYIVKTKVRVIDESKPENKIQDLEYIDYYKTRQLRERALFQLTLAGIMHDIGHGPFSHAFDGVIATSQQKKYLEDKYKQLIKAQKLKKDDSQLSWKELEKIIPKQEKKWKHQEASELLIDTIMKQNPFIKYFLDEQDQNSIERVKRLISGIPNPDQKRPWQFQLISNNFTGIDVDKLDYFRRDAYHLGAQQIFIDNDLLFRQSRIKKAYEYIWNQEQKRTYKKQIQRICYPTKYAGKVIDVFHSRYQLFKYYYLNHKANGIQAMITDVLKGQSLSKKLWDACVQLRNKKSSSYVKLTDYVLNEIQNTQLQIYKNDSQKKEEYKNAQTIIKRLRKRDIYKLVGIFECRFETPQSFEAVEQLFQPHQIEKLLQSTKVLKDEYSVITNTASFGKDKKNLIKQVCLFDKQIQNNWVVYKDAQTGEKKQKIQNHTMLYTDFYVEKYVSVYLKNINLDHVQAINDKLQYFLPKKLNEKLSKEKIKQTTVKHHYSKFTIHQNAYTLSSIRQQMQQTRPGGSFQDEQF